jgi:hypothetical protein
MIFTRPRPLPMPCAGWAVLWCSADGFVVTGLRKCHAPDIRLGNQEPLFEDSVVDGVSFWISGPRQRSAYSNLTAYVARIRELLGPERPILTGGYVTCEWRHSFFCSLACHFPPSPFPSHRIYLA